MGSLSGGGRGGGLARHHGVVLCHRLIRPGHPDSVRHGGQFDLIGLKLGFTTPEAEALAWALRLRGQLAEPQARLVHFDGDDDLNVQWPELPGGVDRDVKKHAFADSAAYLRVYQGKSHLTDHLHRTQGLLLTDHAVQSSGRWTLHRWARSGWGGTSRSMTRSTTCSAVFPSLAWTGVPWTLPRGPMCRPRCGRMEGKARAVRPWQDEPGRRWRRRWARLGSCPGSQSCCRRFYKAIWGGVTRRPPGMAIRHRNIGPWRVGSMGQPRVV